MQINLVFHDIVRTLNKSHNKYTIDTFMFWQIIKFCENVEISQPSINFCYYFDDGYISFYKYVFPFLNKTNYHKFKLGIITDKIGKKDYLNHDHITRLYSCGISICSHSVSHPAFCIYNKNNTHKLVTKKGGAYRTRPYGKKFSLAENEIKFQLIESKNKLEKIIQSNIEEFILPYGLYNDKILKICLKYYQKIVTCDKNILITNNRVLPRILIKR